MNNVKKVIAVMICLALFFITSVVSKADVNNSAVNIQIVFDKSSYSVYDTANMSVYIKNSSNNELSGVTAYISAENLKIAKGSPSNIFEIGIISAGDSKEIGMSAVIDRNAAGIGFFDRIVLFFKQLFNKPADFKSYSNSGKVKSTESLEVKFGNVKSKVIVTVWFTQTEESSSQLTETNTSIENTSSVNTESTTIINGVVYIIGDDGILIPYSNNSSYNGILSSGKYTMKATIKNEDTTVPITYYADGGKYSISTKMKTSEVSSITTQFLSDGSNHYLLIPTMMMYIKSESESFSEMLSSFFKKLSNYYDSNSSTTEINCDEYTIGIIERLTLGELFNIENKQFIKTETIIIDGKEYETKEYKSDKNETVRYYFLDNDIKRIELIKEDGNKAIIEITSVSASVPSSAFTIPSTYKDMTDSFNEN